MASQKNIRIKECSVGIISDKDVYIRGDVVVGTSSEELFEELDPLRESKVFKGRTKDISKLETLFFGENGKRKVVIFGLPGFGKTELAKRFAKHCEDSTKIDKAFWINAESSENLKNLDKTLKKVYKIFENKRCLFIFDNGVSRASIARYEPPENNNFYLLVTSQIADWGDDINQMSLKPLSMEASIDVFREILGGRYQIDEENVYKKMTNFVSNVPLGLIVIAGHLRSKMDACKQTKYDSDHFLKDISTMLKKKIHYSQFNAYELSISAAICVALDKMLKQDFAESEQTRSLTAKLLGTCAYLNPDFINIKVIKEIMQCSEEITVDECVYLSEIFSFIEYQDGIIKIHRLCQRILKLYFDEIKKDYYRGCVRWLLRSGEFNMHKESILMEADDNKEIIFEIFEQNYYVDNLLELLVNHGCYKCCKLIFDKTSFEEIKQYVDKLKLLHDAVESNQADVFELLLKYGDLTVEDYAGYTPMRDAIQFRNVNIVRMILEKEKDVRDNEGRTPLHWASFNGNVDIVRMLLETGGDVHADTNEVSTPLHKNETLCHEVVDILKMLLKRGDSLSQEEKDIVRMLLEKGGHVNARDIKGNTPLHVACWQGNVDIVRLLLKAEADVHAQDSEGRTPLHFASRQGNVDIMRMLS